MRTSLRTPLRIFLAFFLFATMAGAGIRGVNQGGGQPELDAYTIVDNLLAITGRIVQQARELNLSAADSADLQKLISLASQHPILNYPDFATLPDGQCFAVSDHWDGKMTLSYSCLYTENQLPLSFQQVAQVTFAALLSQFSPQNSAEVQALATKMASLIGEDQSRMAVPVGDFQWSLVIQSVKNLTDKKMEFLSLQGPNSNDLTQYLYQQLSACSAVVFQDISGLTVQSNQDSEEDRVQSAVLLGSATGTCVAPDNSARSFTAQFQLKLSFLKGAFQADKTEAKLFQIRY